MTNFIWGVSVIGLCIKLRLIYRLRFVKQPAALDDERRNDLVLDEHKPLDVVVVSRQDSAAHDQLLLEASATEWEHVDLGAVRAAVLVEDNAMRWHQDEG